MAPKWVALASQTRAKSAEDTGCARDVAVDRAALATEKELCMSGDQVRGVEPEGEPFKALVSGQRMRVAEGMNFL